MKNLSCLSLAAMLLATTSQTALAVEASAFADRLVETSRLMGVVFSYGSATADGDTITLSDFTIAIPGEDDIEVPGDVVFTGVAEAEDGAYSAQTATIADFEYTDDEEGISVSFVDIAAEGIVLPANPTIDTIIEVGYDLYDRISAGPLTVSDDEGNELFAVDLMEVTMEDPTEDGTIVSAYQVSGIRGDLSSIEEPEAQEVIEAFGLAQFNASMSGSGAWSPQSGMVTIDDISFVVDELGSISMNFAAGGYTETLYRETMKANLKMSEMMEAGVEIDDEQMAALSDSMLELMADVTLIDGAMRYDDNSLFNKVLDFVGAEQGVDGETFKAGLQFMVPMALAEVDDADFKAMVTSAVNTFIADPQNFTISVSPEEPIAFSQFAEMESEIESDPFVLVDLLNLEITANQ